MSELKELKHAFDIIQQKLNACHDEQRNIVSKMSVKRSLLQESFNVLQNNLGTSLKQDLQKKKRIKNDKTIERLEPIIGTFEPETQEQDAVVKEKFKLIQCKGWVRDRRVWIQARGCPLTNNIQNARLNLAPNIHSPETTSVNSTSHLKENVITELYLTFDLLDFIDLTALKVYCILNDNSFTTSLYSIDWINDPYDLAWKEQLMSISLLTNNVIQAYFPCHLSVQHHPDNFNIIESLDLIRLNERLLLSKDQLFVISNDEKDGALDLFGLDHSIIYQLASLFTFISTQHQDTTKELIKSLGDQYVTLEHNHLNKARLQTALLLSEFTEK